MAGNAETDGILPVEMSPKYLHSNSTSHTWAFSAIAELIDNAYDPDVMATSLQIDKVDIKGNTVLTIKDNGNGMSQEQLRRMLSFGYNDKKEVDGLKPIGRYGNGFKSGSMRIGKDAVVLTKCQNSMSVGFLSQTYLASIDARTVIVPIVTWSLPENRRECTVKEYKNLKAILDHCPLFSSEAELLRSMDDYMGKLRDHQTGTHILIYNLKRGEKTDLELDFASDHKDIRCPITIIEDKHDKARQIVIPEPAYRQSLKEYCSILYKEPHMKISIRGHWVKNKLIHLSLAEKVTDYYKPSWLDKKKKVWIKFGFNKHLEDPESYGLVMYHNNRLIKAFEKVGCQKKVNKQGVGVIGVLDADFLDPIHNKQDFSNENQKYKTLLDTVGKKLNDYYQVKRGEGTKPEETEKCPRAEWIQCWNKNCKKNRRLIEGYNPDMSKPWYCKDNQDGVYNRCDIRQECANEMETPIKTAVRPARKPRDTRRNTKTDLASLQDNREESSNQSDTNPVMSPKQTCPVQMKVCDKGTGSCTTDAPDASYAAPESSIDGSSALGPGGQSNARTAVNVQGQTRRRQSGSENSVSCVTFSGSGTSGHRRFDHPGTSYVEEAVDGMASHQNGSKGQRKRKGGRPGNSSDGIKVKRTNGQLGFSSEDSFVGPGGEEMLLTEASDSGLLVPEKNRIRNNSRASQNDERFVAASSQTEDVVLGYMSPEEKDLNKLSPLEKNQILFSKIREVQDLKNDLISLKQQHAKNLRQKSEESSAPRDCRKKQFDNLNRYESQMRDVKRN